MINQLNVSYVSTVNRLKKKMLLINNTNILNKKKITIQLVHQVFSDLFKNVTQSEKKLKSADLSSGQCDS